MWDFPPPKRKGPGRPAVKGKRLPSLAQVLKAPATLWQRHTVPLWYGRTNRTIEIATGTAIWYHGGLPPVPIRRILVRDSTCEFEPQAFLCTDLDARPKQIVDWFISRRQVEVTFEETRAHLGVETRRQWSDLAILGTTPALSGLFSIVVPWMHDLTRLRDIAAKTAAWYPKTVLTFSDAIAAVRREIWNHQIFFMSRSPAETVKIPCDAWERIANAVTYAR